MISLILMLATGCGEDPVLEAAREEAASGSGAAGGSPGPPAQPSPGDPGQPSPGAASEPTPGIPDEPPPGDPGQPPPGGKAHAEGEIPPPQGVETVKVSGSVAVEDYSGGKITLDVFDGDHSAVGGDRPNVVGRVVLDQPGPFELTVAKDSPIWLSAFNDADGDNRPSKKEPFGAYPDNPVKPRGDVTGIDLSLKTHK